jgi:hypothetical protein
MTLPAFQAIWRGMVNDEWEAMWKKLIVAYFILVSTLAYSSNLKTEATCSSGTGTILGKNYKVRSSSLNTSLQPIVTFSLLASFSSASHSHTHSV